ncbi:hypothetical protein FDECE_5650 [Fusarium decemcellulare]|nr:hypothetical protein FDECE_5650 [Fusarium decemcellulare]
MASALAFPQQNQQHQSLPVQTVKGNGVDSNLFDALAVFVTTGPGAKNTTEDEINDMASTAISKPGGRAHLESLIQAKQCRPDCKVWKGIAAAGGTIDLGKIGLKMNLKVAGLQTSYEAKADGFFIPYNGPLPAGSVYYNEFADIARGAANFTLRVDGLTLHIGLSRNGEPIASFVFQHIPFMFAPMVVEGTGTWF